MDLMTDNIVYHYCPNDSFMSILSNFTLRMSNIRKSNDYTEVINCMDIFCAALRLACNKFAYSHADDTVFREFYAESQLDRIVEDAIANDSLTYYATCFSKGRDVLSQWRGYADDATGVSIGFDSAILKNASKSRRMRYEAVEYDAKAAKEKLVAKIIRKLQDVKKVRGGAITNTDYANAISPMISEFVYDAVFYKNSAFSEEKEWRLVLYPFGDIYKLSLPYKTRDLSAHCLYYDRMFEHIHNSESCYGDFKLKPLAFRLVQNSLTSYCDLDFSGVAPSFIREIMLGPKNHMNDLDLRLFLLSLGFNLNKIKISRSNATYQ